MFFPPVYCFIHGHYTKKHINFYFFYCYKNHFFIYFCERILSMNINVNDIFDFYELRIKSHVAAVNYFASLLGYHFPEHDGDKVIEPIRTGYS